MTNLDYFKKSQIYDFLVPFSGYSNEEKASFQLEECEIPKDSCKVESNKEKWFIGGRNGNFPTPAVFTCDSNATKTLHETSLNQGRWNSSCALASGSKQGGNNSASIIVVGGLIGKGNFTSSVEIYSGGEWKKLAPFPVKVCCGKIIYHEDKDLLVYSEGLTGQIFTICY